MLLFIIISIVSCEGTYTEKAPNAFDCIHSGKRFYYKSVDSTGVLDSTYMIEFKYDYKYTRYYTNPNNFNRFLSSYLDMQFEKSDSGLIKSCRTGSILFYYRYLRVPAFPSLNQILYQFRKEGDTISNYRVTSIDTTIKTEVIDVNCFSLVNDSMKVIEYWNEKIGLIQIDDFDQNNELIQSYKLYKVTPKDSLFTP